MEVALYADNSLPLPLTTLCEGLNRRAVSIRFVVGSEPFRLSTPRIDPPLDAERLLSQGLLSEASSYALSCLATHVPYANNFFFEGWGNLVVMSFTGWSGLTSVPVTNGFVYFITVALVRHLGLGEIHEENTGCVNDFLWDKRGVDVGMRAAFLCSRCANVTPQNEGTRRALIDIQAILDSVSSASRLNADILEVLGEKSDAEEAEFDLFLCHNSEDKSELRRINEVLKGAGVRTWLDEEQLALGLPWQPQLEEQIESVRAAAVFVGESGRGPWQDAEIRAFLNQFHNRRCPVIPVLLPDAPIIPDLPLFLREMMWLDLREDFEAGVARLKAV